MATSRLLRFIENRTLAIDGLIDVLHRPVARFMRRHPASRSVLDGTRLGHPLHPALVAIPIGAWSTGSVLDTVSILGGGPPCAMAADLAYLLGLVGAWGALITGLAEWSYLKGNARRVAFVHAASNLMATGLITTSLIWRVAGFRWIGMSFSMLAFAAVGLGGWLGGELAFHYGAGVGRVSSARDD
jgi:uncharacterized membrane protein